MRDGFSLGELILDEQGKPVDYHVLAINPAYARMFGLKEEDWQGKTMREAQSAASQSAASQPDLETFLEVFGRVALTGEPAAFEYLLPTTCRYMRITVYSPRRGQFATLVEDVNERRLAEESLRESETRFRQLAEGVSEAFWLSQAGTGQVLYVSPAYERIFGRSGADLLRDPNVFFENIHAEDLPRVTQAMRSLLERGVLLDEAYRILRPDGETRWVWARVFPVSDAHGAVTRYSGIAEDITERRTAEQTLRQSEAQLRESYTRLERSLHRMAALRNVDVAITTHTDQASMAEAILAHVLESAEVDASVLFVPNLPTPGRPRGTGPLSALRLAGLVGLPESALDGTVLGWQMLMVNHVFQTSQPLYISDLRQDPHPGAQTLHRAAGFNTCAVLPLLARGQSKGVLQFFLRQVHALDNDWQTFLQSLALQTAIGIDHVEMLENLKRTNRELASAYDETIKGWAQALELRDKETRGHAERVTDLTVRLASAMGMTGESLDHIRRGAFLHDIGKMAIPDSILGKTGPLTNDDWITMRQHPTIGYRMLSNIEYLKPALDVVYCHHEKWDGTGYPRALKGDEIPLSARIFAVVDVWDALTNNRPYRLAWPDAEVVNYLQKESGRQFDPRIVSVFLALHPR
jgi:PAS domain S-box-containing protein/putative nucleotidyltransferase with HDIG domain